MLSVSFPRRPAMFSRFTFPAVLTSLLLGGSAILLAPASRARLQTTATNPPASSSAPVKRAKPEFSTGDVLVRFRKDKAFEGTTSLPVPQSEVTSQTGALSGPQRVASQLNQEQVSIRVDRFEGSDLVDGLRIARVAPEDTMKAIAALKALPDVLYAERNYIRRADTTTPNDPSFSQLYGLQKIGAPQAWDITTGSKSVVVGVIDEGIDTSHQDLQANIWVNPSPGSIPGITGDINGYDFFHNSGNVFSGLLSESHASHVAGTVGAVGNNGVGVVGVNWQVSLMSLKFLGPNGGTDADAIRAFNYARQMHDLWISSGGSKGANLRALNNSYGGGGYSQAMADAINALAQDGILFVAAAGNEGVNTDITRPNYPSDYNLPNVISVAATDSADQLAGFSNYGPRSVTIGAPGVSILSTTPGNTYQYFSGTSMATPHVTGAAALICAKYPNIAVQNLRAALIFNGDIIPALQGRSLTGRRLNVFNSFQALAQNDVTPPGTVGNFQIASQLGRAANLSWIASGDDGAVGQASLYDISFTDQSTGAVIPLTSVIPAASGVAQSASISIPYRHTAGTVKLREFDKVGNEGIPATVSVNIDPIIADPYVMSLRSPAALSTGGTPLGLTFDDRYRESYPLPFAFPFFGQNYNAVTISTNGNLYFSPPPKRSNGDADDVPSSTADLARFKMIAGLWDDLTLETIWRSDADVYVVQPDSNWIIFRWQGVPCHDQGYGCTGGDPINFEIELGSDGRITTRYGSGNTNLNPVVGISGGEPDAYVIDALTSEDLPKNLTDARSATFTPRQLTNPVDDARAFVTQHYLDFLNRAPDQAGLDYWTSQITKCGIDAACIHNRRISVSAAFFMGLEFQQTGYVVYRLYRAAYGAMPGAPSRANITFLQFMADRPLVVVGFGLAQSTIDFANNFVQRPEFKQVYPDTMSAADFVNQLFDTANLTPYDQQRQDEIDALQSGARTRAGVLLDVIEFSEFKTREYNPAFVLMQYFGYLRRDPDQAGYDFWLNVLNNREPSNFRGMVCSFITSAEYQLRFGTQVTRANRDCSP